MPYYIFHGLTETDGESEIIAVIKSSASAEKIKQLIRKESKKKKQFHLMDRYERKKWYNAVLQKYPSIQIIDIIPIDVEFIY